MNQQLTNSSTQQQARPLSLGSTATPRRGGKAASQTAAAQAALSIMQRLQTTLDIPQMLQFFAEEAVQLVALDGLEYSHAPLAISCHLGRQSRHSAAYRLTLGEDMLGTLTFRRGRKFGDADLKRIEDLLCHLLYPLRNAIAYEEALHAARRDPLTGLFNRATLDETLDREMQRALRHEHALSLVVLDVDHFKRINDEHGHDTGDQVLKAVAESIRSAVRDTDMAFRFGGEEFVILLNETPREGAGVVAERLRARLAGEPVILADGTPLIVTASFGVATLTGQGSGQALFKAADTAMYRAKQDGRNCIHVA